MEKRLSITAVVPVHNTGVYISKCLDSIINQTYKPIEIICIDSSTDDTSSFVGDIAKDNSIIEHIIDSNSSYGYKLNLGIKIAKGELICIVDSDDYIGGDMFEKNELLMRYNNLDFCRNDYYDFISKNGENIDVSYQNICALESYYNHVTNLEIEPYIIRDTGSSIWTGLYSAEFLRNANIILNESEGASYQDTSFGLMTLFCAKRIMFNHEAFYRYRIDNDNSSVKNDTKYLKIIDEFKYFEKMISVEKMADDVKSSYYEKKIGTYWWNYERLSLEYKKLFLDSIREEIRNIMSLEIYKNFSYNGCHRLLKLVTEML